MIHDTIPAYPSEQAKRRDEDTLVLADWDEETEETFLKEGVNLPDDRGGFMVFEDGTVVLSEHREWRMFTIADSDVDLIEKKQQTVLEVSHEVHNYTPS